LVVIVRRRVVKVVEVVAVAVMVVVEQLEMYQMHTFVELPIPMQYHHVIDVADLVHRPIVPRVRVVSGMFINVLWRFHDLILRSDRLYHQQSLHRFLPLLQQHRFLRVFLRSFLHLLRIMEVAVVVVNHSCLQDYHPCCVQALMRNWKEPALQQRKAVLVNLVHLVKCVTRLKNAMPKVRE
jgi:hypothetical protein